jgi:hypothetical protein
LFSFIFIVLSDNKPQVRTAATEALDCIAPETGLESLLPHIAEALKPDGPILRKDLLLWLAQRFKVDTKVTKDGVSQLLKPVILCLNDRSGGQHFTYLFICRSLTKITYFPVFSFRC